MNTSNAPAEFAAQDLQNLQATVARFAKQAIASHVSAWEEAGLIDRGLYTQAAELGLLGLGYPEHLGGTPAPWRARNLLSQTGARYGGSGGVMASLFHTTSPCPPSWRTAAPNCKPKWCHPCCAANASQPWPSPSPAVARTWPACAPQRVPTAATMSSMAKKTFITSGLRADWITLAVRTDGAHKGAKGISMLMVPGDTPGISRTRLHKMGWHSSDTAQLHFDRVRVPQRYRLGDEGAGFKMVMGNFNGERLAMSAMALGFAQACFDEALAWSRQRQTFGAALVERQVIRHKLMDMQMRISSTQAWVDAVTQQADAGQTGPAWVADVCLLKNHATQCMQFCADAAVQMLGGMGYMRGTVSERVYREVKVMMIGGGAEEIMKELAAKQLGL